MKKIIIILFFIIFLLLAQLTATIYQLSRYYYSPDSNRSYACAEMSADQEIFFESLGIRTSLVQGSSSASGHRWLLLHLGPLDLHFESTALMFADPRCFKPYVNVKISDGYIVNNSISEELVWKALGSS